MLQKREKVLLLRTFQGRTLRIVREHYLRPSVPCNSPLCPQPAACRNGQGWGRAGPERVVQPWAAGARAAGPGRQAPRRCWGRSARSRGSRPEASGSRSGPALGLRAGSKARGPGAAPTAAAHCVLWVSIPALPTASLSDGRAQSLAPPQPGGRASGASRRAGGRRNLPLVHPQHVVVVKWGGGVELRAPHGEVGRHPAAPRGPAVAC